MRLGVKTRRWSVTAALTVTAAVGILSTIQPGGDPNPTGDSTTAVVAATGSSNTGGGVLQTIGRTIPPDSLQNDTVAALNTSGNGSSATGGGQLQSSANSKPPGGSGDPDRVSAAAWHNPTASAPSTDVDKHCEGKGESPAD